MTLLNRSDRFKKRLEAYRLRSDQQKEKQAERDNIDAEVNFIFEGANMNSAGSTSQWLNVEKNILTLNIFDDFQVEVSYACNVIENGYIEVTNKQEEVRGELCWVCGDIINIKESLSSHMEASHKNV